MYLFATCHSLVAVGNLHDLLFTGQSAHTCGCHDAQPCPVPGSVLTFWGAPEVLELCAGGDLDKHMKGQGGPYSEYQAQKPS